MNWLGEFEKSLLPKLAALMTLPEEKEPALNMGAGWMPIELVMLPEVEGDDQRLWLWLEEEEDAMEMGCEAVAMVN